MRMLWLGIGMCVAGAAHAQSADAPLVAANDSWVYQGTVEKGTGWQQNRSEATVVRAGPSSILLSKRPAGSRLPPTEQMLGADWSRIRSVDGHETVVNRPLSFPLRTGRSWVVEYTETNPNRQHTSEHFRSAYRVMGWEDVTVPAGVFHAIKIEAEGEWQAALAPALSAASGSRIDAQGSTAVVQTNRTIPRTVSGRTYKAFWYVPAVKRWVKSVEEYYDGNGVRNERYTDELESYKVAG